MIVNSKQYESLCHQMLHDAAPALWTLLTAPPDTTGAILGKGDKMEKFQRRALHELAAISRIPVPRHHYFDVGLKDEVVDAG